MFQAMFWIHHIEKDAIEIKELLTYIIYCLFFNNTHLFMAHKISLCAIFHAFAEVLKKKKNIKGRDVAE